MLAETIIMGILQGLLEWLPVSSQGSLILFVVSFLGISEAEALSLSVYLHAGTLLSVLVYFRRIFWGLLKTAPNYQIRNPYRREDRLLTFLVLSTILTGAVGYPIFKVAAAAASGSFFFALIGAALILTGILQRSNRRLGSRTIEEINLKDSLILGIVQGFSAFPGISRSGITISFLLFRRLDSESAFKLSFIMSAPAILAAVTGLALTGGLTFLEPLEAASGLLASFLSGLASISLLLRIAKRITVWKLCVAIGLIALLSGIYPL
jgi:undecaprenyl-diphosphatase